MRSNLLDMQESRLVAKRHKPAFWFRVMVANRTAVWLEVRVPRLHAWAFMQGVIPRGFSFVACLPLRVPRAPSYDRLISAIFLGRFTWVSLIIKAFF